jgi:hypothetical protein
MPRTSNQEISLKAVYCHRRHDCLIRSKYGLSTAPLPKNPRQPLAQSWQRSHRSLLCEGVAAKCGFIVKHRGSWPTAWLCEALGVSLGGFYAWLTRPRSQRARRDKVLGAKIRKSFLQSDRAFGSRRVWHDLLAEGDGCGLHRMERLMRKQALRARPRRRIRTWLYVPQWRTSSLCKLYDSFPEIVRSWRGLRASPCASCPRPEEVRHDE